MGKGLQKISIRMESGLLSEVDSLVDHIRIKNRSDALRFIVRRSLKRVRTAVILSKGIDTPRQDLRDNMLLEDGNYNLLHDLGNGRTLAEEQVTLLKRNGFSRIIFLTIPDVISELRKLLESVRGVEYVANKGGLRTMDALRLLKGRLNSEFLVFFGHDYPNMDLKGIYDHHVQTNHYVTLNLTWGGPEAMSYVEVEGTKIKKFIEKKQVGAHLTYNAVFVVNPKFLGEKGHSVTYDVFSRLSSENLLDAFITQHRILKLTSEGDKKTILDLIETVRSKFFS